MADSLALARELLACRIVDLSSDVWVHEKGPFETRMDVVEAEDGAQIFCDRVAGRLIPEAAGRIVPEDFPDRAFLRHELVTASVHAGSHIDAPGHYGPQHGGGPAFVSEAPLESFVGPGVALDLTGLPGWQIEADHVKAAVQAAGADLHDGDIVLLHTEQDKAVSAGAVELLLDQGVRVVGTDADGFDGRFEAILGRFLETGDRGALWPAHMLGRWRPYYQIERLRNLHLLPATGFLVMALPVLIGEATAAWTRAVAFVPAAATPPTAGTTDG